MRHFFSVLAIAYTVTFGISSETIALEVMIDPGHGGIDTGTANVSLREKDLVLKVAGYLNTLLKDNPLYSVKMTRTSDQHVSLAERVKRAENAQADLFLSLHANSNPSTRVKGMELYFQNSLPPDEESLLLAAQENSNERAQTLKAHGIASSSPSKKSDVLAIVEDLHRQYRARSSLAMTQLLSKNWLENESYSQAAIKQAPFYVVSKTTMPSVLIEVGFLTHPEESRRLASPKYQQQIAQKIYKAIGQFKEMMDNLEGQALE
jgi:N-acetylmuramoyl-L-alanine amidase